MRTGYPPADSIAQPSSGMASMAAYSATCDALAANACTRGSEAGSGGGG